MGVREIVSDECFVGWPELITDRRSRQVAYHFLRADEQVVCEEMENGETVIRAGDWSRVTTYDPGLEPVIIRRRS